LCDEDPVTSPYQTALAHVGVGLALCGFVFLQNNTTELTPTSFFFLVCVYFVLFLFLFFFFLVEEVFPPQTKKKGQNKTNKTNKQTKKEKPLCQFGWAFCSLTLVLLHN
jgi:Na+/melibiose symporter-like transporter